MLETFKLTVYNYATLPHKSLLVQILQVEEIKLSTSK
jgi:hypothetical protein